MKGRNSLSGPLADVAGDAGYVAITRSASASSPTPRSASAARPARWPASSGTPCPRTGSTCSACRTTTPARSARTPGGTSRSSSSRVAPAPGSRPRRAAHRPDGYPAHRPRRSRRCCAAAERGGGELGTSPLAPAQEVEHDGTAGSPTQDLGHARVSAAPATATARRGARVPLADGLGRVQALHARRLPGRLPDRRAVPHRVRHRRRAAGHLQRLRLLRLRLPVRRDRPAPGDGRAQKCTLCYDRLHDGLEPACAKACPTDSIQFGELDELRERAAGAWSSCTAAGSPRRGSTARPGRRRRRQRRVLPAARRAGGLRPAAGPGRADPRRRRMWRRPGRRPARSLLAGIGAFVPGRSGHAGEPERIHRRPGRAVRARRRRGAGRAGADVPGHPGRAPARRAGRLPGAAA